MFSIILEVIVNRFHLAKTVARFTHYQPRESFTKKFDDPSYECFTYEDTSIHTDLEQDRVSLAAHPESNQVLS